MCGATHHPLKPWHVDRPHLRAELGDLPLHRGGVIEQAFVGYVTHGRLAPAGDNLVVALSAIGSTHHRLDFLIGPGKALDPAHDFIVCVDALGNGQSSSPSNSRCQPGAAFPAFDLRDMIEATRRLLDQVFDVRRPALVIGASMGGMQAVQWACAHPDEVPEMVALTAMARSHPWARLLNQACREALCPGGDDVHALDEPGQRAGWKRWSLIFRAMLNRTPQALADERDLARYVERFEVDTLEQRLHPGDWVAQSHAYDRHDVGVFSAEPAQKAAAGLAAADDAATDAALARIRARTLILAPPLDLYNPVEESHRLARAIRGARFEQIPSVQGHQAAQQVDPVDADWINDRIRVFRQS